MYRIELYFVFGDRDNAMKASKILKWLYNNMRRFASYTQSHYSGYKDV